MSTISPSQLLQMRSQILQQNAALQKVSAGAAAPVGGVAGGAADPGAVGGIADGGTRPADFTSALKDALNQVNDLQAKASDASSAYEKGETTDIAAVMLAREQSSVGFQATLQVRNKLLSAYKDIMSMPV